MILKILNIIDNGNGWCAINDIFFNRVHILHKPYTYTDTKANKTQVVLILVHTITFEELPKKLNFQAILLYKDKEILPVYKVDSISQDFGGDKIEYGGTNSVVGSWTISKSPELTSSVGSTTSEKESTISQEIKVISDKKKLIAWFILFQNMRKKIKK